MKLLATAFSAATLALPGLQTGSPPWLPEWTHLRERLQSIGLPVLSAEAFVVHIHQHLDLYVNGRHVPIPALVGINVDEQFLSPIHTHDFSGIIHVESPTKRRFTLGEFFDVYGVRFTSRCVGGQCGRVRAWANGRPYAGDPRRLVLTSHEEIVVAVGRPPRNIPARFAFPAGFY